MKNSNCTFIQVAVVLAIGLMPYPSSDAVSGQRWDAGGDRPPAGDVHMGACCLRGHLEPLPERECLEQGGRFFERPEDAERECRGESPHKGMGACCLHGRLEPLPEPECRERNGGFFERPEDAERECRGEAPHKGMGACCLRGRLEPLPERECLEQGGRFFDQLEIAERECRGKAPIIMEEAHRLDGAAHLTPELKHHNPNGRIPIRPVDDPHLTEGEDHLKPKPELKYGDPGGQIQKKGADAPNLIIEKVSWNPASFPLNGTVKFSYSLKNNGTKAANPVPGVGFTTNGKAPSGARISAPPVTGLAPGQSMYYESTTASNCIDGKATVKIVADPDNQTQETNENDNTWTHDLTCSELPNLAIGSYSFWTSTTGICSYTYSSGNNANTCMSFRFTVMNKGDADIVRHSSYSIRKGGAAVGQIPPLKAGENWEERITARIYCPGWISFELPTAWGITLDSTNVIKESNENDNYKYYSKCD
jgi:hypothetical protein